MTAPNRNVLWAETMVEELAAAGVARAVLAPGSRCTPLTVAMAAHDEIDARSLLDERSAGFFALGQGKPTGVPTAVVTTSGTATANLHPAVIEADAAGVPLIVLTADRPPELHDSGANQTIDQDQLYGDAVRHYRTLPEPAPRSRALRSLRVTVARTVAAATGTHPGPVHLNVPFRKPLEPTPVEGDVPDDFDTEARQAVDGSREQFLTVDQGQPTLPDDTLDRLTSTVETASRGLLVAGPANRATPEREALADLARASGFPVLADPLSGHRFGHNGEDVLVCGGYDSYLEAAPAWEWPDPDLVIRFGRSPTSKVCRKYLRDAAGRQLVVDPAGEFPEATFTASDLLVADPTWLARTLAGRLDGAVRGEWYHRFDAVESAYWTLIADRATGENFEGAILSRVAADAPEESTLFVSNSRPVRDLDRFGQPRSTTVEAMGNRGASGIDGIISTALGAGSVTDGPLVLAIGDLAFYHDLNGLLALQRCDLDATIVLINNDGGGIFHTLPIQAFDPPFTEFFETSHGLDFEPVGDLYGAEFVRAASMDSFTSLYQESLDSPGAQIIEVSTDAADSHRKRETIQEALKSDLAGLWTD